VDFLFSKDSFSPKKKPVEIRIILGRIFMSSTCVLFFFLWIFLLVRFSYHSRRVRCDLDLFLLIHSFILKNVIFYLNVGSNWNFIKNLFGLILLIHSFILTNIIFYLNIGSSWNSIKNFLSFLYWVIILG